MDRSSPLLAPLTYLPTFEIAARHLSFKRAAEELHLTPSAVSQQMRALEEALGLSLFRRKTRALELTSAGEQFASVVKDALDTYRRGTERLLRQHLRHVVRMSTDPFVAHELLIPALPTLASVETPLDLRLETSAKLADLERDGLDAAVRYGVGPWAGFWSTPVCDVVAAMVCAPGLIEGDRLSSPAMLARLPLIRLRDQPDPWSVLARAFKLELPAERLVLDSYFATVRAAEKGLGVAMGIFPITTSAVLEGRLVIPSAIRAHVRAKYHFVCRHEDAQLPTFVALRAWLCERFLELPALPDTHAATFLNEADLLSP